MPSPSVAFESSPAADVMRLMSAFQTSQPIYALVKLGIPDLLATGPRSVDALSLETRTDRPSLLRLLRGLSGIGLLTESESEHFALAPLADSLRHDAEPSMRDAVLWSGEYMYATWGQLLETVRTGVPAFERVFGLPTFAYFDAHPEAGAVFDGAMNAYLSLTARHVAASYAFPATGRIVDVGGGSGHLLAAILERHTGARGALVEVARVAERARQLFEERGLLDRCDVIAGDFFRAVPEGGDVYLLSRVLHDWDDSSALAILRQCRAAMSLPSRLLIVERVLPNEGTTGALRFRDLGMMILGGGRERSQTEWTHLLAGAELEIIGSRPVASDTEDQILEAQIAVERQPTTRP
jgi:SAM-dependent methyltransferase